MTATLKAAEQIYFAHKSKGIVGDPLPMLAEILALGASELAARDAEIAGLRGALEKVNVEIRDVECESAADSQAVGRCIDTITVALTGGCGAMRDGSCCWVSTAPIGAIVCQECRRPKPEALTRGEGV